MESGRKPRIRSKHRFGFNGPRKWQLSDDVTVDDFLETIAKRRELSGQIEPETIGQLDNDPEVLAQGFSTNLASVTRKSNVAKSLFIVMFAAVAALLWQYGSVASLLSLSTVDRIVQSSELSSAFANPLNLALVVFVCFVPALVLWKKRKPEATVLS